MGRHILSMCGCSKPKTSTTIWLRETKIWSNLSGKTADLRAPTTNRLYGSQAKRLQRKTHVDSQQPLVYEKYKTTNTHFLSFHPQVYLHHVPPTNHLWVTDEQGGEPQCPSGGEQRGGVSLSTPPCSPCPQKTEAKAVNQTSSEPKPFWWGPTAGVLTPETQTEGQRLVELCLRLRLRRFLILLMVSKTILCGKSSVIFLWVGCSLWPLTDLSEELQASPAVFCFFLNSTFTSRFRKWA